MVEALIAIVVSILVIAVFHSPAWAMPFISIGGLGFSVYVLILVIKWLLNYPWKRSTPPA